MWLGQIAIHSTFLDARAPVPRRLETRLPEAERSSQSTEGLKSIGRPNRECQAPICKDLAVVRAQ